MNENHTFHESWSARTTWQGVLKGLTPQNTIFLELLAIYFGIPLTEILEQQTFATLEHTEESEQSLDTLKR